MPKGEISQEEKIRQQVSQFSYEIGLISPIPNKKPDEKSKLEDEDLARQQQKNELKKQEILLGALSEDIGARKKYAKGIFILVICWFTIILGLIVLDGLYMMTISDNVIIALIGGTTLNVVGLFHFVLKYIYHTPEEKN